MKAEITKRMTLSAPPERKLFYGTSPSDAEKICSDKFDRSFAGKNGKCIMHFILECGADRVCFYCVFILFKATEKC